MGNGEVAVDTGFPISLCACMPGLRFFGLQVQIHLVGMVAIAAFQRIGCLHTAPDFLRERGAVRLEFFLGVDHSREVAPKLEGGGHLALDHVNRGTRNVAIRANCADTRAVGIVNGSLIFCVYGVTHLVTADAKLLGIGPGQASRTRCHQAACNNHQTEQANAQYQKCPEPRRVFLPESRPYFFHHHGIPFVSALTTLSGKYPGNEVLDFRIALGFGRVVYLFFAIDLDLGVGGQLH